MSNQTNSVPSWQRRLEQERTRREYAMRRAGDFDEPNDGGRLMTGIVIGAMLSAPLWIGLVYAVLFFLT